MMMRRRKVSLVLLDSKSSWISRTFSPQAPFAVELSMRST
jgi:hypothetical protein